MLGRGRASVSARGVVCDEIGSSSGTGDGMTPAIEDLFRPGDPPAAAVYGGAA